MAGLGTLAALNARIVACELCPRLRAHCTEVARVRRRAYADWEYWGRPVPSFGDAKARVLALGLAPGAHGSNRTGRMFTGDGSGDFLLSRSARGRVCLAAHGNFARRRHEAERPVDQRRGALRSAGQQAHA